MKTGWCSPAPQPPRGSSVGGVRTGVVHTPYFFLFFHFSKWRFSAFWCIFSKFFYVCSVYKIISLSKKCWQWRQGGGRQICPCVHPPMYSTQDTTSSHYKARPVPRPAVPQNTTEPILVWGMSASHDSTWGYTFTSVIINLLRCDSTSEWTRMRRWLWYSPWGDVDLLLIMSTNSTTSYVGLSTVTCQRGLSWVRRTRITTHINMTGCEHKELTFKSSYLEIWVWDLQGHWKWRGSIDHVSCTFWYTYYTCILHIYNSLCIIHIMHVYLR